MSSENNTQINIRKVWEENIKKLNETEGFSLIRTYKKRKFKFAITHFSDLVQFEEDYPEEKSVINNPELKGITKMLMKRRVEAMHAMDLDYKI